MSKKSLSSLRAGTSSNVISTQMRDKNWTGPVKSALQWKWQMLWYCPWIGFRAWQTYGKVLPTSLPFWNNFVGITLRVNYPSGNCWTACWEAENPQPGQCPGPKLVPCLCCSLFTKSLALGQNSLPIPNVSLCLNKALEIKSQSKYLGIIWIIPSLRALHFTHFGTSFKYFRKMF